MLYKDNNGKKRLNNIVQTLNEITLELDNPANADSFYGRVDTLLNELEEIMENYKAEL